MRAVVLSGGGGKGAYQIGVWKALRKLNYDYKIVTGTSIGAINGLMMAQKSFYISSTGNDNNYGDTNNPLLTVEEVLNRIKFIKSGTVELIVNDNYTGNIIIEEIIKI